MESWYKRPFRLRQWLLLFTSIIIFATGLVLTILAFMAELALGKAYVQEIGSELSQNLASIVEFTIEEAEDFCKTSNIFLSRYQINETSRDRMARFIADHMSQNPGLSSAFYTEEETGMSIQVYQEVQLEINPRYRPGSILQKRELQTVKVFVEEIKPLSGEKNLFEIKKYAIDDYPSKPLEVKTLENLNFRNRDSYQKAKHLDSNTLGVWTESYEFLYRGFKGSKNGLTYSTPMRNPEGKFLGVFGVDIPTDWLSEYLHTSLRNIGRKGIHSFIFEKRMDGSFRIVAHSEKNDSFPLKQDGELGFLCLPSEMRTRVVGDMIDNLPQKFKDLKDSDDSEMIMFNSGGKEIVGVVRDLFPGRPPQLVVCIYMSKHELFANAYAHARWNFLATLLVMGLSGTASLLMSRTTSKPLEGLAVSADKIGKLDFAPRLGMQSRIFEVRNLSNSMQRMEIGLQSFIRYLPKSLLQNLFETGQGAKPGGVERLLTISFTDIQDFSHFSELMPPNELVFQLNEYLGCFSSVIDENKGTVDKYIGDAVMAYWNAPNDCQDHAYMACVAAIRGMQKLEELQKSWARQGKPIFKARVGINTGNAIVGNIGTEEHLNYTAIGDNINLASRLEGLNKTYGTRILITEATLSEVSGRVISRPVDLVAVKGKGIRVMVYELLGLKGEVSSDVEQQSLEFAVAHKKYMAKDWSGALDLFVNISLKSPTDGLVALFIQRCRDYLQNPPGAGWDGSQEFKTK